MSEELKITLVKSTIGAKPKHRRTAQALGLKKPSRSVVKKNNPATWGMINQINHLVKVEEV